MLHLIPGLLKLTNFLTDWIESGRPISALLNAGLLVQNYYLVVGSNS